jgi:ABC-type sugar transport system ATPase subunit
MTDGPLLVLRGIHKRFPGVHALKGVDLDVRRGEVHALVGENGAGKSTLMQILAGVHRPDAGTIGFDGRDDVVFPDEHAAQRSGIALVFQERSLFGPMSVAENVFAARQPVGRWRRIDRRELESRTRALLDEVGVAVPPDAPVEELSSAQQQLVEIAKGLSLRPKLLIFDEPTAALSPAETEQLFAVIRRLRSQGVGMIYISHRLAEIFTLCDRITVLKDGAGQGTFATADLRPAELVHRMVGRDVDLHRRRAEAPPADARAMLEVSDLNDPPGRRPRLRNIGFSVRAGEIVGFAGLVGAGRTELAMTLFGARRAASGRVRIDGRPVRIDSPADALAAGIGYLSEDRKEGGLFLEMSLAENMAAVVAAQPGSWRYRESGHQRAAEERIRDLRIVCRGPAEPAQNLSGGNQQKVVLAKWLAARPRVFIVDEPTRGVDVGAKAEIHQLLFELARGGAAVMVISSDLPEVLAVSDRILVMREGRIAGELTAAQATEKSIMKFASMG